MKHTYYTFGTCSRQIDLVVVDNIIKQVAFTGGCHGNLQGISKLVEGMRCEDAIAILEGIKCGYKDTSCPDQLAKALREAISQ